MGVNTSHKGAALTSAESVHGTHTRTFPPPRRAQTAVFFIPALTGAGNCKLQVAAPIRSDQDALTWFDLDAVIFATGSGVGTMSMAGFLDSTAYSIPIQGLGGA